MVLNVLFISSVISPAQAQENPVGVAQELNTDSRQPGSPEDLWKIKTLGFRGQALHSLTTLGELEIFSRCAGDNQGWRVVYNKNGNVTKTEVAAIADWLYIPSVKEILPGRKSYTPHLEGDVPAVVMEFLSDKDGGEYSFKRTYPPGKWFFYEQILQVPVYIIFDPDGGLIEYYELKNERYELKQPDENGRHWIESMELFLGTWQGTKEGRTGYWLRWWEQTGNLLPWALELIEQERQQVEQERQRAEREHQRAEQERQEKEREHQRAEQEHQRAEQERQRAEQERQEKERLIAYLRSQGIDPNNLPNHTE